MDSTGVRSQVEDRVPVPPERRGTCAGQGRVGLGKVIDRSDGLTRGPFEKDKLWNGKSGVLR